MLEAIQENEKEEQKYYTDKEKTLINATFRTNNTIPRYIEISIYRGLLVCKSDFNNLFQKVSFTLFMISPINIWYNFFYFPI